MDRAMFAQWAAVAALAIGVLVLWVEAGFGGDDVTLAAVDLANVLGALLAGAACWWRGDREPGKPGRGWRLLALGCLAWGAGVLYISYFDLVVEAGVPIAERTVPFPSIADIGYLAFVPFALAGVLLIPRGIFTSGLRLKHAVDGAIVALGLLAVCWVVVLRGMWQADLGGPLETVILLAYPWGDFLIAAACILAWNFVPREEREGLLLLVVGLGLFALADLGFYVLVLRGADAAGISPINVLWPAGFAAIALAALRPPLPLREAIAAREPTNALVPLAAVAGGLALSFDAVNGGVVMGTGVLGILTIGLLLARLLITESDRRRAQQLAMRHPGE